MAPPRPRIDLLRHERAALELYPGAGAVAGIDEAGRGPLAGPVVAAAVVLPRDFDPERLPVRDSKTLTARRREELDRALRSAPGIAWSVCFRSAAAIDRLDILRATHECMRECIANLLEEPCFGPEDFPFGDPERFPRLSPWRPRPRPGFALVDGLPVPGFPVAAEFVVGGDRLSASIAAASILAKTWRDRYLVELDARYPMYGFARHKGYGTKAHYAALREHGPCPEHRRSFTLVKEDPGNLPRQLHLNLS